MIPPASAQKHDIERDEVTKTKSSADLVSFQCKIVNADQ